MRPSRASDSPPVIACSLRLGVTRPILMIDRSRWVGGSCPGLGPRRGQHIAASFAEEGSAHVQGHESIFRFFGRRRAEGQEVLWPDARAGGLRSAWAAGAAYRWR